MVYNMYSLILFFSPGLGRAPSETFGLGHPGSWQIVRTPGATKYCQQSALQGLGGIVMEMMS